MDDPNTILEALLFRKWLSHNLGVDRTAPDTPIGCLGECINGWNTIYSRGRCLVDWTTPVAISGDLHGCAGDGVAGGVGDGTVDGAIELGIGRQNKDKQKD